MKSVAAQGRRHIGPYSLSEPLSHPSLSRTNRTFRFVDFFAKILNSDTIGSGAPRTYAACKRFG